MRTQKQNLTNMKANDMTLPASSSLRSFALCDMFAVTIVVRGSFDSSSLQAQRFKPFRWAETAIGVSSVKEPLCVGLIYVLTLRL